MNEGNGSVLAKFYKFYTLEFGATKIKNSQPTRRGYQGTQSGAGCLLGLPNKPIHELFYGGNVVNKSNHLPRAPDAPIRVAPPLGLPPPLTVD